MNAGEWLGEWRGHGPWRGEWRRRGRSPLSAGGTGPVSRRAAGFALWRAALARPEAVSLQASGPRPELGARR